MTMAMAQLLKKILTKKGGKLANIRDMGAYHQRIVRRYGGTGPAYRRANNMIKKAKKTPLQFLTGGTFLEENVIILLFFHHS